MYKSLFNIILLCALPLQATYCIQVLTSNISDKNSLIRKASSRDYSGLENVRVESRGRYIVLRVGDYPTYREASQDISYVQGVSADAYIRKCDFNEEEALYIRDKSYDRRGYSYRKERITKKQNYKRTKTTYRDKQEYQSMPAVPVETKVREPQYEKKRELKYKSTKSSDTLWSDCKKCFVPIYKDELDLEY